MVMADYVHLQPATRPIAAEDARSRIRRIRTDRWLAYARAEAVLAALEDLLPFPKRLRMPNLLLVGPTNNGKTMIVEKFRLGPTKAGSSVRYWRRSVCRTVRATEWRLSKTPRFASCAPRARGCL